MHGVDDVKPRPWQGQHPPSRRLHPWPQMDHRAARPCLACHHFAAPAVSKPPLTTSWYASALVSWCWALLRPGTRLVDMGSDDGCLKRIADKSSKHPQRPICLSVLLHWDSPATKQSTYSCATPNPHPPPPSPHHPSTLLSAPSVLSSHTLSDSDLLIDRHRLNNTRLDIPTCTKQTKQQAMHSVTVNPLQITPKP